MGQSDLIALVIWVALLTGLLVLASALWIKQRRLAAVWALLVGWSLLAGLAGVLIWKGHSIRARHRQMEQQQVLDRASVVGLSNHRLHLTSTLRA